MSSLLIIAIISILIAAFSWKAYFDRLSIPWRIYYILNGFNSRNKSFSLNLLNERNDTKRLICLIPYVAASFTPAIFLLEKNKLILGSLAYVYWRVLDTFDDLLIGEERERGLCILYDRLQRLHEHGVASNDYEIDNYSFSIAGPRDRIYIIIVKHIEILDSIFLSIDRADRDMLLRFVKNQTEDFVFARRSHFKTDYQYHDRCLSVIMTGLYLSTFEINKSLYGREIDKNTKDMLEDTCEAFSTGNIIKDLETDFRQGISYHPDLCPRGIIDEIASDEMIKISECREYLTYRGIQKLPSTCAMFKSEWNNSYRTKFMALLLKTYLLNNYRKHWSNFRGEHFRALDTKRVFAWCLVKTLWDWETGIMELDQEMLSWRPDVKPLWEGRS